MSALQCARLPLPPRNLSPNARPHFAVKAEAVKNYRRACQIEYRRARLQPLTKPARVHLDFFLARGPQSKGRYIPRDEDNARAAFKAGQDALADAGIVPDDGAKFLRLGETRLHTSAKDHGGQSCVVVTLEEIETS